MFVLRIAALAAIAAPLLLAQPAGAAAFSSFTSGAEGWDVVTGDVSGVVTSQPADVFAAGGNPGGYIAATDPDALNTYFRAGPAFLGNHADALGGVLSYSRRVDTPALDYDTSDVVLQGAGITLVRDLALPGQIGVWDEVALTLAPGQGWTNYDTGLPASGAEFQSVLGNVSALYVLAEFTNGLVETTSLDNVTLAAAAVPEPLSAALLVSAIGLLGAARRRVG